MTIPEIKSVEFWARESSMPLFWITDPDHELGVSTLILFKNKIFHLYYLNDSQKINETLGHNFFSKKENYRNYISNAEEFISKIKVIENEYESLNFKNLDDSVLFSKWSFILRNLEDYSRIYSMTEASVMKKFESEIDFDPEELGKLRLKFRELGKSLFFILIGKILSEVAKRNSLSLKGELFFYDFDELNSLVKTKIKVAESVIKSRKKGFAVLREKSKSVLFTEADSKILWDKIQEFTMPKNGVSEFEGRSAFMGKVTGVVRILFQKQSKTDLENDVYNLRDGEILVTDMTKPDMFLACKKASAIVTDEGGITCHGAILARELGKPCVVGTKIATQVLKNGDLIEVDATNGKVKILKRISK